VFPLRDVIPSRTTPVVTMAIIVVNVLAFLYEESFDPNSLDAFIRTWGFVPVVFTWPSIFGSMFLHGGLWHLAGNMWSLWIFGDNVEDRLGHFRYLGFYVLCGVVAAVAHFWSDPTSAVPTIGASGAIAGIMGAYFVLYPRSRVLTLVFLIFYIDIIEVPAVVFLGFWFLMQLVSGVGALAATTQASGGIAFWAHVAGFAAGAALVKLLARPIQGEWWDSAERPEGL
jgi:membrane associated rhomboid family serine protease